MDYEQARDWPVANPFVTTKTVGPDDIDGFGHVNNLRYIEWALEAAWAHSNALGVTFEDYRRIGVGCVVVRHEFDYLRALLPGERIDIATWIAENDSRVRLTRAYEMREAGAGRAAFRGRTTFVTVDMETGRPARMPPAFVRAYERALDR